MEASFVRNLFGCIHGGPHVDTGLSGKCAEAARFDVKTCCWGVFVEARATVYRL